METQEITRIPERSFSKIALSSDGLSLATLSFKNVLQIRSSKTLNLIKSFAAAFDDEGLCWNIDETKIYAVKETDNIQSIYEIDVETAQETFITNGNYPQVVRDTGQLTFLRGSDLYIISDGKEHLLKSLDLQTRFNSLRSAQCYNMSPDGKYVIYSARIHNPLSGHGRVLLTLAECKPDGKQHIIDEYFRLPFTWATEAAFLKTTPEQQIKSENHPQ